uniref:Uncharacterized protein n=1 Tax=Craspedostauros australis TaxID=1486917 RepID=A0A7R9WXB1_9STRA
MPYRVMAQTMDGIRTFQQYGRFQPSGLSYQQIWDKYREQAIASMEAGVEFSEGGDLTEDDVTAKICLKILEKSCATNPGVDKWLLSKPGATNGAGAMGHPDLEFITQQLERDVRKLLDTTTAQTEVQRRLSSPRGRWFGGGNEHDTAVTVDGDGDVASIDFESDSTGGGGNEGNEHGTNVQFETSSSGTATTSDTDHRNTNANTKANDDTVKADAPNARQQALALQKYRTWRAIAKAKRHAQTVYQNHASAPTSEVKIARTESPDLREDSTSDGPHEVDQHISERLAGEFRSAGASHHKQHWSNRSSRHRQRHNKRWTNRQQPSRNKD